MEKTMDRILVVLGTAIAVFTACMIILYIFTGGIPDTLCTCFYSICGGECGFMAIIKSFKIMREQRKWQVEDRKYATKNGETCTFAGENSNYDYNNYGENENIVE